MTIVSMTGFAESAGSHEGLRWRWEAKSVNGRSLDLRLRTPPGFDALEQPARMLAVERFRRGNFQINLDVSRPRAARAGLTVDPVALASAVKLAREVAAETGTGAGPYRRSSGPQRRDRAGRGGDRSIPSARTS